MTDIPAASPRRPLSLARSISATWWYTAGSVVFFHIGTLGVWLLPLLILPSPTSALHVVLFAAGAALSLAAAVGMLAEYRRGTEAEGADAAWPPSRATLWWFAGMLAAAVLLGLASSSLLFAVGVAGYALCLLRWTPGIRWRLVLLSSAVLIAVWIVEGPVLQPEVDVTLPHPFFAVALPAATVLSLWWWDVVVALDRARAAESRLAAVQERLRLAGDLHDLQGHHLQVIALQLELAERTMASDPTASVEHVRAARRSVDDARRGTRDLAGRFRGVPLPDELANAADLLRAAGVRVELDVDPDAAAAPADILGPVVRESTTNVLKHGGGAWARLALRRHDGTWVLEVANDPREDASTVGEGAGLTGIADRVGAVGGMLRSTGDGDRFRIVVTVPAEEAP